MVYMTSYTPPIPRCIWPPSSNCIRVVSISANENCVASTMVHTLVCHARRDWHTCFSFSEVNVGSWCVTDSDAEEVYPHSHSMSWCERTIFPSHSFMSVFEPIVRRSDESHGRTKTSRLCSRASRAVMSVHDLSHAWATSTPWLMPATRLLRIGKLYRSGWVQSANGDMSEPPDATIFS